MNVLRGNGEKMRPYFGWEMDLRELHGGKKKLFKVHFTTLYSLKDSLLSFLMLFYLRKRPEIGQKSVKLLFNELEI